MSIGGQEVVRVAKGEAIHLPLSVMWSLMLTALMSGNTAYLVPMGSLVFSSLLNHGAKRYLGSGLDERSSQRELLGRPLGLHPNMKRVRTMKQEHLGCGMQPAKWNERDMYAPGMPSGHAQSIVGISTFMVLWAIARRIEPGADDTTMKDTPHSWRISDQHVAAIASVAIAMSIAVLVQRKTSLCHSYEQLLAGSVIGIILGYLSYEASSYVSPETFPSLRHRMAHKLK